MAEHELYKDGVSITEAARVLGTSRPTLSKLLSDADFPRRKAGGKTLVSLAAVRAFYEVRKLGGSLAASRPEPELGPGPELEQPSAAQPDTGAVAGAELEQLRRMVLGHQAQLERLSAQRALPRPELSLWAVIKAMFSPWGC